MPSTSIATSPSKRKSTAKRRRLVTGLSGAELLARAQSGEFGRGIDWTSVELAHASRRRRTRAV